MKSISSIFLFSIPFVLHAALAQFHDLQAMQVAAEYRPTSGVAVAKTTYPGDETLHVFYRGPKFQLLHLIISEDNRYFVLDHGRKLLTAPAASGTNEKDIEVAYVNENQQVVHCRFNDGYLDGENLVGIKSQYAPAIDSSAETYFDIYATRIDNKLVSVRRESDNSYGPIQTLGMTASGGPSIFKERSYLALLVRNSRNFLMERRNGKWSRVNSNSSRQFTSDVCGQIISEGGSRVFGRGDNGKLVSFTEFIDNGYEWSEGSPDESPVLIGNPGCHERRGYCILVVMPGLEDLHRISYCT